MDAREKGLKQLTLPAQLMYAVLEQDGPQATKYFQENRKLSDGQQWEWSRADYPTKPRTELEREGLIRAQVKTSLPVIYEVTPVDRIAAQKKKWERKEAEAEKKQRARSSSGLLKGSAAWVAECRRQEKELGTMSRAQFIERRRRVVELAIETSRIEGMLFWSEKSVPKDEFEMVYERLLMAHTVLGDVLKSAELFRTDAEARETIAKLRNVNGRSPEEAKRFLEKADELEQSLLG